MMMSSVPRVICLITGHLSSWISSWGPRARRGKRCCRRRCQWLTSILAGQRPQKVDDQPDVVGRELPSELRLAHGVHGVCQGPRVAVMKVRRGHGDVAQARHSEDVLVAGHTRDEKTSRVFF